MECILQHKIGRNTELYFANRSKHLNMSLPKSIDSFLFDGIMSICEEEHEKACANENGELEDDHQYYLLSKLHSVPCIKWRFDRILFNRFNK